MFNSVKMRSRRAFLAASAGALWAGFSNQPIGTALAQQGVAKGIPAHSRPIYIERSGLRVRDLEKMIRFYQQIIGLEIVTREMSGALLGAGGVGLLELLRDPGATVAAPDAAGLYHIAFEMPTRLDLARWIIHAAASQYPVIGLADHRVSESVYLNDPEGNGIEVYASRPESQWKWNSGQLAMGVFDFDVDDILKLTDREKDDYSAAPPALRIGHIHLRVGDLATAERFYSEIIGLDVTRRARGAIFMSSGKYHHHVAVNIWESPGAKLREERELGLGWFSMAVREQSILDDQEARLRESGIPVKKVAGRLDVADPWGNKIRLTLV